MNKHLNILKQLTKWYWNKESYKCGTWSRLTLYQQKYWFKFYMYDYLKNE